MNKFTVNFTDDRGQAFKYVIEALSFAHALEVAERRFSNATQGEHEIASIQSVKMEPA